MHAGIIFSIIQRIVILALRWHFASKYLKETDMSHKANLYTLIEQSGIWTKSLCYFYRTVRTIRY